MAAPYDLIAGKFASARVEFRERPYVDRFLELAQPGVHLLDLGCGTGFPIARHLIDRGFRVTGVDTSAELLRFAKARCPEAELVLGDMTGIDFRSPFGGVVAWDSVFHVPRALHHALYCSISRWLRPGAPLLLSVGGSEGEFHAPMFGADFFYSGHSPAENRRLLESCDFDVVLEEVDDPSSRGHLVIVARKGG